MNYKEKYEQALKMAQETYNTQPMYREWLEKMFPELKEKESEDEKVRKDVKRAISVALDYSYFDKETANNCLAWLEKQGEKSVKWNENTDGNKPQKHHSVLMKTTHGITEGEWNGNETWIQYRWSSSIKDSDVLFWIELSDIEKQGEQKPSDEEMKTLLRTEYEKGRADAIAEMQGEWSEEDIIHLNNCISYMSRLDSSEMDWLKSLNGRVQPQSKTEWSEEDSRILYNVKAYIGYAAGQRGVRDELFKEANEWLNSLPIGFIYNKNYNEDMVTLLVGELKQIANDNNAPEQYQVEINWLKSLKPQNRWMPSERQLACLQDAIEHYHLMGSPATTLTEILKQLRKLKDGKV